ncbi:MAG TPA: hypothetical protein VND70_00670 [Acidimicrobiales bacterium]|nr:hypothetical protein [Acidimicrobiales bacterium]
MLAAGCTGFEALNPICQGAAAAGSLGGTLATSGIDAVLSGLSHWVASGAEYLLGQIGDVLLRTTTIDIGASWFRTHYGDMAALAGVVILPLLLVSTLQAVYRQNPGQLLRAFVVQLPLALLLGAAAIQIVILSLSATDAMCSAVAGGSGSAVTALLEGLTKGLIAAVGAPGVATFVLLMVGLLVAVAAFVLWLELLIRAAAVYVAVLFLPLALATLVWPSVSHWCRRLVETLAALILSKFVIVATLSLAAGAISAGTAGAGDAGSGFAPVLAGGALLVLSTFVPFAILRLIPAIEAGAIGHLDGLRQRGTASMTRLPRTAASFALTQGMAAAGDARLIAETGPPGTPGALAGVGGGGGGGGGPDAAGATEAADAALVAQVDNDNGGLLPDSQGRMVGNPASPATYDAVMARGDVEPRDRGPKPVLAAAGTGGGTADDGLPEGVQIIGRADPGHMRYYFGQDEMGPVLKYLPPSEPRPDRWRADSPESTGGVDWAAWVSGE